MPKGGNKMDTKSDENFLAIEAFIKANNQESDKNHKNTDEKLKVLTENLKKLTTFMMDQTNIPKSSLAKKYTLTPPEPTTVVQTNTRDPPLEGGNSSDIGGMLTLKHEISSPKVYVLLINTELKGDTALDIKHFFNHIKMSLNAVTRLR